MKRSRRYKAIVAKVDKNKSYVIEDAVKLIKELHTTKFDESVEVALNLGVDPKQSDQLIRGTVSLPHGTGKTVRVLVINRGDKDQEAKDAGADYVGFQDYLKKIQEGWLDFDVVVATPDSMSEVGKLGKILGTKGLMPNPKSGTVTADIGRTVREIKAGRIDFRVDKFGILHTAVGKSSFLVDHLTENIISFMATVIRLRPSSAKGQYIRKFTVSTTMGPGIKIDHNDLINRLK